MTRRKAIVFGLTVTCATLPLPSSPPATSPADEVNPSITVLFAPGDDCIKAIVEELNAATSSIRVQAYVLTSDVIGAALVGAKQRGVDVRVMLDAQVSHSVGSKAESLLANKAVVRVDGSHHQAHNKIIIIDRSVVITGSLDFSEKAAKQNAENLLIIKGHPEVARRYNLNWSADYKHSTPYIAADKPSEDKTAPAMKGPGESAGNATAANGKHIVYVTKYGKRYHRKDCQHVRAGAEAITRDEAIKRGLTPCKRCRPD